MIKYVKGNLFEAKPPVTIAHVVNDRGAWGAGFVLPLARKYPKAKSSYLAWYRGELNHLPDYLFDLGNVYPVEVAPGVVVAHMLCQVGIGRGKRRLHYGHLANCIRELSNEMASPRMPNKLVMPRIGCGLAGGDWNIVEELLEASLLLPTVYTL